MLPPLKRISVLFLSILLLIGCGKKESRDGGAKFPVKVSYIPGDTVGSIEGFDTANPSRKIFFENVGGKAVINGDIAVGNIEELPSLIQGEMERRTNSANRPDSIIARGTLAASTSDDNDLWPRGIVPYRFAVSVPKGTRDVVLAAMAQYSQNTPIRFVEVPSEREIRYNELIMNIQVNGSRPDQCGELLGYPALARRVGPTVGFGYSICTSTRVSLSVMLHEIGHILGLYHEHQRPDRDQFVNVTPSNASCAISNGAFRKNTPSTQGFFDYFGIRTTSFGPYDFGSIMHYPLGRHSDPSCRGGGAVLSRRGGLKNGSYLGGNGQQQLSAQDIRSLNLLYTGRAISRPINLAVTQTGSRRVRLSLENIAGPNSNFTLEYNEVGANNWRVGTQVRSSPPGSFGYYFNIDLFSLNPDTEYEFRAFSSKPHPDGIITSDFTETIATKTAPLQSSRVGITISGLQAGERVNLSMSLNPNNLPNVETGQENISATTNGTIYFSREVDADTPVVLTSGQPSQLAHRQCIFKQTSRLAGTLNCPTGYLISGRVSRANGPITVRIGSETLTSNVNQYFRVRNQILHGTRVDFVVVSQPAGQICTFNLPSREVIAPTTDNNVTCVTSAP